MRFEERLETIGRLCADGDTTAAEELALEHFRISKGRQLFNDDVVRILEAFKHERCFESLCRLADRSLLIGADDPRIYPLYAQGMIDRGQLEPAILFLRRFDDRAFRPEVRKEIVGLLGRAYKQRFVESAGLGEPDATDLTRAIACYDEMYDADPAWGGANLVALAHRAEREGEDHNLGVKSGELASQVIDRVRPMLESTSKESSSYPWLLASIAEVSLATRDWQNVVHYYGEFATSESVKPFHLASAARQLREIWGAVPGGEDPPSRILTQLDVRALCTGSGGGQVAYSADEGRRVLEQIDRPEDDEYAEKLGNLQAVLGSNRQTPINVMRKLLERAPSVCRVVNRHKLPSLRTGGSGFLVDGRQLAAESRFAEDEAWNGPLLVTNNHVLSRDGVRPSLRVDQAVVVIDEFDRSWHIEGILWQSPLEELDVTIARPAFGDGADGLNTIELSALDEPLRPTKPTESDEKVYVVGHPNADILSFGLSDNFVQDHEFHERGTPDQGYCRIHYGTPTEHGNSGGPVLDENEFKVIGVHRAVASGPMRALPSDVEYKANEAVAMRSVRERLLQ